MTTTAAFGCVLHWPPTPRWEWVGREVNTSNARFRLHNSLFGILWIKTNNIEQTSFFRRAAGSKLPAIQCLRNDEDIIVG